MLTQEELSKRLRDPSNLPDKYKFREYPAAGYKNDIGKERFDLIPFGPLFELAKVYTMGATKYDDWNWAKGLAYSRVFAAMMRHAWKFWRGEEFDPDGQHHLDSVAWCAFALREYQLHAGRYKEFDDRRIAHETRL